MADRLEPEYADAFKAYQADPRQLGGLLGPLDSHISRAVKTHTGRTDPVLMGRARRLVVDSLPKYDARQSSLRTYVQHQLRGMVRYAAQRAQLVHVPERVAIERRRAEEGENSLRSELAREPTDDEVADYVGVPHKRLAYIRGYSPAVASSVLTDSDDSTAAGSILPGQDDAKNRAWVHMVADSLDPYHRAVLENTLGLHGRKPLSNQVLAAKLNRSPGAISQAKLRIQKLLDDEDTMGLL